MDIFNQRILDELVVGTANVFTDTQYADLLGSVESLSVGGKAMGVMGTLPTITIQFEHSFDGARWVSQQATPEVNAVGLVSPDTYIQGRNTPGLALFRFVRLRIALGGTTPSAVLQLWAVGRSPTK